MALVGEETVQGSGKNKPRNVSVQAWLSLWGEESVGWDLLPEKASPCISTNPTQTMPEALDPSQSFLFFWNEEKAWAELGAQPSTGEERSEIKGNLCFHGSFQTLT